MEMNEALNEEDLVNYYDSNLVKLSLPKSSNPDDPCLNRVKSCNLKVNNENNAKYAYKNFVKMISDATDETIC